jgi:hypothetical protein
LKFFHQVNLLRPAIGILNHRKTKHRGRVTQGTFIANAKGANGPAV